MKRATAGGEQAAESATSEQSSGQTSGESKKGAKAGEAARKSASTSKEKTGGEKGGEGGAKKKQKKKEKPPEERGKVVNTEKSKEVSVSGRGTRKGDKRLVHTGVNAQGVPGYQHIATAAPVKLNTYRLSFTGEVSAAGNIVRAGDDNRMAAGRLVVHGMPIEHFSFNLGLGARNNVNNFGRPRAMLSQGDITLGLRGHYAPVEGVDLAAAGTLYFTNGFGSAGTDFAGTGFRPRLLGTFDLDTLTGKGTEVPLNVDVNVDYLVDNTQNTVPDGVRLTRVERFAHDISAYDTLGFGLGVEYDDLPYVAPFAAWNLDIPLAPAVETCETTRPLQCPEAVGFASYPNVLSFGLRAEPVEQLGLHAGVDLSLTARQAAGVPTTPPYRLILGASWSIDPEPRVKTIRKEIVETRQVEKMPPRGTLVGTVEDAETGEPVGGATVVYLDRERSGQTTDTEDGTFRTYEFPPDTALSLKIDHPEYHSKTVDKTVVEGEKTFSIQLEPKPDEATVAGTVVDQKGESIAGATVSLEGPQSIEVTTDAGGSFKTKVKAGEYTVAATSSDYIAAGRDLSLKAEESVELTLQLTPAPDSTLATVEQKKIAVEERVAFESGEAKLTDDSKLILDKVAGLLFKHPEIAKVQVQGHTDDVGSEEANMKLSRKRAEAVVSYLVDEGVDADRLVPKGYGPKRPKVPNISARNRRLNRRVEFKILRRE
ncbi:MAG: carboxypeptidase regulatory-like domain-containing protein [Bradymonadaceae bacterium]